jgi:DNA polymerase-1
LAIWQISNFVNYFPMSRFVILDGNAILHRAWHALPPLTAPNGQTVNAAYGFTMMLLKVLKDLKPTHIAVAFDRKEPTFRHKEFKEYKAQRIKQPQEFYDQLPVVQRILDAFKIARFEAAGYEADDIIATLCDHLEVDTSQMDTIIATGDKDTLQLIDGNTRVMLLKRGITDTVIHDQKSIKELYGVAPLQLIDVKALAGDPSDNIPGAKGIGEKTALRLIQEFGSIEQLYGEGKGEVIFSIKKSVAEKLRASRQAVLQGKRLVTLIHNVPLEFHLQNVALVSYDQDKVRAVFAELGFKTLMGRIADSAGSIQSREIELPKEVRSQNIEHFLESIRRYKGFSFVLKTSVKNLFGENFEGIECGTPDGVFFIPSSDLIACRFLFEDPTVLKISHDLKNAMHIFKKQGVRLCPPFFDSMLAAYLLEPGRRAYTLSDLFLLQNIEVRKSIGEALWLLAFGQKKKLEENGLLKLYEEIEMPLIPILYEMEEAGIMIDKKFLAELKTKVDNRIAELEMRIWDVAGERFNVASPLQLREILFEKLKLPAKGIGKTKTGISTAAEELEKLKGKHPIIAFLQEHRELSKLRSTYIDVLPFLTDQQNRVHTTFNQTITATGRLSSSEPNLQNIPVRTELGREIRKAFVAKEGNKLIALDYSQIELRIAASLSCDATMISAFQDKEDIHTRTASEIFDLAPKAVTPEMRRVAKTINFGVLYGMGPQSLAQNIGSSYEKAQDFIDRYFTHFSGLTTYLESTKELARGLGYVETLFGRRRYIPEINSGVPYVRAEAERQAMNHGIQGTAADIIKMAMISVSGVIKPWGQKVKMLLQVHDELVFEVEKELVSEVALLLKKTMENVTQLRVPLVTEVKIGDNWGEMSNTYFLKSNLAV